MEYRVGSRILSERKPTADSRAFQVFYKYPISANLRAYVGSQGKSAGNEGLTDHSSRDLYSVWPHSNLPGTLARVQRVCPGVWGRSPQGLPAAEGSGPFTCHQPDNCL